MIPRRCHTILDQTKAVCKPTSHRCQDDPSDGSLITELPDKLILEFKGSVRLTLVTIKHNDNSKIKLNLNSSLGFVSKHNVPVSFKDTGSYFVEWRGLGTDGHTLKGSFEFNVK